MAGLFTVDHDIKLNSTKKRYLYWKKHNKRYRIHTNDDKIQNGEDVMKASEFIGMKVLDSEANEVGKVAEIAVVFKKCLLDKVFISIGSAINKKYLVIVDNDIAEVGDYLQLKLNRKEIDEQVKVDKIEEFLGKATRYKEFMGKTVLTKAGMDVGKISDMMIDPKGCLIHNIVVTTGGTLNKKHLMISDDDIEAMGDYLIIKLDQDQINDRIIN